MTQSGHLGRLIFLSGSGPTLSQRCRILALDVGNEGCLCGWSPMPHFYFHLRQGEEIIEDEEGQDLPDVAAAQDEALKSLREMAAQSILSGDDFPDSFLVTDADGNEITSVPVASVLPPRLKGR